MINRDEISKLDHAALVELCLASEKLNEQHKQLIGTLQAQVEQLNAKYEKLTRMLFGRKSERFVSPHPDQMSLFNDQSDDDSAVQPSTTEVQSFKRKTPKKSAHKGRPAPAKCKAH